MKYITLLFLTLISISAFSQSTNDTIEYVDVILDGKPGYMNVNTGEFVTTIPQSVIDRLSVVKSSPKPQNSVSQPVETGFDMDASTHVVTKGETLYSISKKYDTSIAALKALNEGTSLDIISIGQQIIVRRNRKNMTIEEIEDAEQEQLSTPVDASNSYEVKKGDTLYSISRMFNTNVEALKQLNNLTSNAISVGQIIRVK